MTDIQEKFKAYLEMQKQIVEFRKKQKESKKILDNLEKEIKQYMIDNEMDSISIKEGEIVLYDRKVSQTFKRETMIEQVKESLKLDDERAEKVVNHIVSNKVYTVEKKIKASKIK